MGGVGLQAFAAARTALDERRKEVMDLLDQHAIELLMKRRDIEQKLVNQTKQFTDELNDVKQEVERFKDYVTGKKEEVCEV